LGNQNTTTRDMDYKQKIKAAHTHTRSHEAPLDFFLIYSTHNPDVTWGLAPLL